MKTRGDKIASEWEIGEADGQTDVVEDPPTNDQLSNILEYLGPAKAGSVVSGASDATDALRKFKDSESAFQRPIVVDWHNGRAGTSHHTEGGCG